MVHGSYQRDDRCRLQLNDAFDIDRVEVKPATAQTLRDQILAWAKHIAGEIPGYTKWQEIYDFMFDALYAPDAVFGSDDTPFGTEDRSRCRAPRRRVRA